MGTERCVADGFVGDPVRIATQLGFRQDWRNYWAVPRWPDLVQLSNEVVDRIAPSTRRWPEDSVLDGFLLAITLLVGPCADPAHP